MTSRPPGWATPIYEPETEIRTPLNVGAFVPFVGAGASSLRWVRRVDNGSWERDPEMHPNWGLIQRRVESLGAHLPASAGDVISKERGYLLRVASEHSLDDMAFLESPTSEQTPLQVLQVNLCRLGGMLWEVFGSVVAHVHEGASLSQGGSVPLSSVEPGVRSSLEEGFRNIMQAIPFKEDEASPSLYPHNIAVKVAGLAHAILGRRGFLALADESTGQSDIHELMMTFAASSAGRASDERLSTDQIEWLGELLWYTLRFDVPLYPTTQELAFELSLIATPIRPPSGPLEQAAQVLLKDLPQTGLVDLIAKRFGFFDTGYSSSPIELYFQIGRALRFQFDYFSLRLKARRDGVLDPNDTQTLLPPLVITTNYDSALETVLRLWGSSYHVVYPLTSGEGDNPDIRWAVKTYESPGARGRYPYLTEHIVLLKNLSESETYVPGPNSVVTAFPDGDSLIGPLILKLHGSPSDASTAVFMDQHEQKGQDIQRRQLQHFLVLSEKFYLESLLEARRGAVPSFLHIYLTELAQNRGALWFLGYSLSDWPVRVQMYRRVRKDSQGKVATVAVFPTIDQFRRALLVDELHVDPIAGDLNRAVTPVLRAALETLRVPATPTQWKVR